MTSPNTDEKNDPVYACYSYTLCYIENMYKYRILEGGKKGCISVSLLTPPNLGYDISSFDRPVIQVQFQFVAVSAAAADFLHLAVLGEDRDPPKI